MNKERDIFKALDIFNILLSTDFYCVFYIYVKQEVNSSCKNKVLVSLSMKGVSCTFKGMVL